MILSTDQIESLDSFQNLDSDPGWKDHEPRFEWTKADLEEFEHQKRIAESERLAMAAWWEMEGVRCATFDRNPNRNPYL